MKFSFLFSLKTDIIKKQKFEKNPNVYKAKCGQIG